MSPVQAAAFLRVGEHQLCYLRSVQLPIFIKIIRSIEAAQLGPGRGAHRHRLPGDLVGVQTSAPRSLNIRATVLLPVPAPPVMAILSKSSDFLQNIS